MRLHLLRILESSKWMTALPLLRLQNEEIFQGDRLDLITPNMFAGSILDLEPGTEYEAKFVMSDMNTVESTTSPQPNPAA